MKLKHIIRDKTCTNCGGDLLDTHEQVFDYSRTEKLYGYPRPVDVTYYAPISECATCKVRYVHKEKGKELLV